jgi:hypothetical protein
MRQQLVCSALSKLGPEGRSEVNSSLEIIVYRPCNGKMDTSAGGAQLNRIELIAMSAGRASFM